MSAKPQESISGRGEHWEKVLGTLYRTIMLENVSVDVVDGARVKGVLGVSVRPLTRYACRRTAWPAP